MPESQPRNLRTVRQITRRDILFSVARVPDTDHLVVGSSEGKVFELDAAQANDEGQALAEHGRYVTSVRLAGGMVISGGYDGRLIWWDRENRRVVRTIDAHGRWIRQLAITADGTKLASVADDMVCRVWDVANGARLHELRGHAERTPQDFTSMLYACAFSPDGRHLATADRIGHTVVWDVAWGRQVAAMDAPFLYTWDGVQRIRSIGGARALAFAPDGVQLAVGGVGQIGNVDGLGGPSRVEVFDWARQQRMREFTGPNGIVNRLHYHPEGRWLCALGGAASGFIMFYDTAARTRVHQANLPMHAQDAVFNEDFTTLYAVGHRKIAVLELSSS